MIRGIVFDKDGTLFDFNATWGAWSRTMLHRESRGEPDVMTRLADVLGYDLAQDRFLPGSIVIAETVGVVADAILTVVPGQDRDALIARMKAASVEVPQVEAVPLGLFIPALKAQGYVLGLATNDAEGPARRHLQVAGVHDDFAFIAGSDSGWGGKPAPGQLLAFLAQTGLAAADCVMVGDSLHDLHAGRAAGMRTLGVLTGPAPAAELAPHADAVLASIAEIPRWIGSLST